MKRSRSSTKYDPTPVEEVDADLHHNNNIAPATKKSKSTSKLTTRQRREAARHFSTFQSGIAERAQHILHKILPTKVLSLQKMIQEMPVYTHALPEKRPANLTSLSSSSTSTSTSTSSSTSTSLPSTSNPFKRTCDTFDGNDPVPVHPLITQLSPQMKSEALTHIESMSILKLWIQLNVPEADDGGNFGVGVQEEVIGEVTRAEEMSFSILEAFNKYWMTRAKLASKVLKYLEIADYWNSIRALDETQYLDLRLTLIDLRNSYSVIYDMLIKNEEKIKDPRGTNHAMSMI